MYLNGAHLTSWTPRGHSEVLWLSGASRFAEGVPVRGGVPICFPWFNRHPRHPGAPQHGFARTQPWVLDEVTERGGAVRAVLRLTDTPLSRASVWPYRFEASYTVTLGQELSLELEIENRDEVAFRFEEALHTYYAVGDVQRTTVDGLSGTEFCEENGSPAREDDPVRLERGVSRRYPSATAARLRDASNRRVIVVTSERAAGSVLWNPGPTGVATLPDFAEDGWRRMLCFENANIGDAAVTLAPGERHRMRTHVRVLTA